MKQGDKIMIDTKWGTFTYLLDREQALPADTTSVVVPKTGVHQLVLTTCNPKYSASQRLVAFPTWKEPRHGQRSWKSRLLELAAWACVSLATAVIMILLSGRLLPANF